MIGDLTTLGFSDAAKFIEAESADNLRLLRNNQVFGSAWEELSEVYHECREPNWDGLGAIAVSQDVCRNGYLFLESLPLGFPPPSVGAEPDGDLTFEWHRAARRILSISVNPGGDLHYAAIIGPSRVYGTEAFFGEIPEGILNLIRRVYSA